MTRKPAILKPGACCHSLMFGLARAAHVEIDSASPLLRRHAADGPSDEDEEIVIAGLAVPFNKFSAAIPGAGKRQVFLPYCFNASLGGDLRVLFNDLDHVLGRTAARTARVWSEADGLHFEAIAPRTSWADDLIASIDRGDISGAGVWCDVTKSHFEYKGGEQIQVIEKADLKAVGVVSFQFFDESWAEAGSHSAVEQIAAGMTYTPSPRMEAL